MRSGHVSTQHPNCAGPLFASTSAEAVVQVLHPARPAPSAHYRVGHRSGSRLKRVEAHPKPSQAPKCPSGPVLQVLQARRGYQRACGCFGNPHLVGLRNAWQASGKIGRLAYDGLLLGSARADQIANDYQTRWDADARLKRRVGFQGTPRLPTPAQRAQPSQRRPRGLAGIQSRSGPRRPCTSQMKPSKRSTVVATHF